MVQGKKKSPHINLISWSAEFSLCGEFNGSLKLRATSQYQCGINSNDCWCRAVSLPSQYIQERCCWRTISSSCVEMGQHQMRKLTCLLYHLPPDNFCPRERRRRRQQNIIARQCSWSIYSHLQLCKTSFFKLSSKLNLFWLQLLSLTSCSVLALANRFLHYPQCHSAPCW